MSTRRPRGRPSMWVAPNLRQSRSKQTGSNLESTNVDETQSDQRSSRGRNQSSSVSRQPNSRLRTTRNTLASSSVRNRVSVDRQTTSTGLRSFKGRQRSRSRIDQRSSSLSLNQSAASNHSSISALSDINQQEEIRHDLPVQNVVNEGEDVQQNQEGEVNRRVKEYFDAVEGARDKWKCKVDECGHELKGHVFHMKRHDISKELPSKYHLQRNRFSPFNCRQREPTDQTSTSDNTTTNEQVIAPRGPKKLDLDLIKQSKASSIRSFYFQNIRLCWSRTDWLTRTAYFLKQEFDATGGLLITYSEGSYHAAIPTNLIILFSEDLRSLLLRHQSC
ncbi:hypothetical protein PVAND_009313 [Polypedilum vanderplanki]|uniref:Uncharacterized protein n=1 Tax=Polypedilum vanderplanki TaxID=319348 RepID=A0A9J6CCX3_POLVA|nr:hypothetical protein PVAND_009313 [Polypedilum vanderplanki]